MGAMLRVDGRVTASPVKIEIVSPWLADFSFSGQAYGKVILTNIRKIYFCKSFKCEQLYLVPQVTFLWALFYTGSGFNANDSSISWRTNVQKRFTGMHTSFEDCSFAITEFEDNSAELLYHFNDDRFMFVSQRYLNAHAYGNVVTDDLWDVLTEVSTNSYVIIIL